MVYRFVKTIAVSACTVLLTACGGQSSPGVASDGAQDKALFRSDKAAASSYAATVQELYLAYFGRPADPTGLANFENALASANAPTDIGGLAAAYATNPAVKNLIDSFGTSQESQVLYGNGNATSFVTAVFQNVLGRQPQASGLSYWAGAINSGALSQGDAALSIMAGARTNTSPQGLIDAQLIANRVAVATQFTSRVSYWAPNGQYSGSLAASVARNTMNAVDSTTNVAAYNGNEVETALDFIYVDAAADAAAVQASGISLFAGNIGEPYYYGPGATAYFYQILSVAVDPTGNVYVLNSEGAPNQSLQKFSPSGFSTVLTAQSFSGAAVDISGLRSVSVDPSGNVYLLGAASTIQKISPAGVASNIALPPSTGALPLYITAMTSDTAGNMYFADGNSCEILAVAPSGNASIYSQAPNSCNTPVAMAVDANGYLYLADGSNTIIKRPPSGPATAFAGGSIGQGTNTQLYQVKGLTIDAAGNLYAADTTTNMLYRITPAGSVTAWAGNSRIFEGAGATFNGEYLSQPQSLAIDASGNIYLADVGNRAVRKVQPDGAISLFAGVENYFYGTADGMGPSARFNGAAGITFDSAGNAYVVDAGNGTLRKITPSGVVSTVKGSPLLTVPATFNNPRNIAIDTGGNIYIADTYAGVVRKLAPDGSMTIFTGSPTASFSKPDVVATDKAGNVYATDNWNIQKITPNGVVTTVPINYRLRLSPFDIAADGNGNVYASDWGTNGVYRIAPNGDATDVLGNSTIDGGTGATGGFNYPTGLVADSAGNIYVADSHAGRIVKVTPSGVATTVIGSSRVTAQIPTLASGFEPNFLAIDPAGNLYATTRTAVYKIKLPAQ